MSPDGSNVKKIAVGKQPSITRDGKKIVFVKGGEIFTMDADGGGVQQLSNAPEGGSNLHPNWGR